MALPAVAGVASLAVYTEVVTVEVTPSAVAGVASLADAGVASLVDLTGSVADGATDWTVLVQV